ncbi:uncharacterized protein LOC119680578 [Teleopsis dalmanni]|uniref:uncharacterized protein LOC119680578 n=1 Tax=Teleopsis dalmanni TaxID=139649 RepID=UPI0018CD1A2C|nr:uncharacterized protein LOC119680578 [Teleopsis dalmanni]
MQSLNTITSSDDSDTVRVYDFNKQETIKIRQEIKEKSAADAVVADTIETATEASTAGPIAKKPRPTELAIQSNTNNANANTNAAANSETPSSPTTPVVTPARGSTPTAFKFLQPKRKLIDPSQVLSFDEDMPEEPLEKPEEKPVIEEDVARALPSVKALARAFILASNKNTKTDKRWPMPKTTKNTLSPAPINKLETSPSVAEIAEDATISSDLSSLETDPPTSKEVEEAIETVAEAVILNDHAKENASPVPVNDSTSGKSNAARKFRSGFLRSNIAFFENLKFK